MPRRNRNATPRTLPPNLWLEEHRELAYLRAAAALRLKPQRRRKRRKGLAGASRRARLVYLRERDRKLKAVGL